VGWAGELALARAVTGPMRRAHALLPLATLLAAGCGGRAAALTVEHVESPALVAAAARPTRVASCTIVGTGEPDGGYRPEAPKPSELVVWTDPSTMRPSVVAHDPSSTHVTWTFEPSLPAGTAAVRFEGQGLRFSGHTSLRGRVFALRSQVPAGPGLRLLVGATGRVLGATDGGLAFRYDASGMTPRELRVTAPCGAVAFEPGIELAAPEADDERELLAPASERLTLRDSPDEAAPSQVVRSSGAFGSLAVLARQGGFTHVRAREDALELDAWVPDAELASDTLFGAVGLGLGGISSCGCGGASVLATALLDADVWLASDDDPSEELARVATLERGAVVKVLGEHGELVDVALDDGRFGAPLGRSFRVRRADLSP
jgi:hypothetical protein